MMQSLTTGQLLIGAGVTLLSGATLGVILKFIYDLIVTRKKTEAEAQSITDSSDLTTRQVTDQQLQNWMRTASELADKYERMKALWGDSQICLKEMVSIIGQVELPEHLKDQYARLELKTAKIFEEGI